MEINTPKEHSISVGKSTSFVELDEPAVDDKNTPAYTLVAPDDYVVGIEQGTFFALEARDVNGDPCDDSSRVIVQRADRQGNPIAHSLAYDGTLDDFVYDSMYADEDYTRHTTRGVLLNEREQLHIYVVTPEGEPAFDKGQSRFKLGDASTGLGKAVNIRERGSLSPKHRQAIDANTK